MALRQYGGESPREIYLRFQEAEVEGLSLRQGWAIEEDSAWVAWGQKRPSPVFLQEIPIQPEYFKAIGASGTQQSEMHPINIRDSLKSACVLQYNNFLPLFKLFDNLIFFLSFKLLFLSLTPPPWNFSSQKASPLC